MYCLEATMQQGGTPGRCLSEGFSSLKDKLQLFILNHPTKFGAAVLDAQDWEQLQHTYAFLRPFYNVTLKAQNTWNSLDEYLKTFDILFDHVYKQEVSILLCLID